MLQALRGVGVPVMTGWSERTTYHIEVKSTQQDCNGVPFFVSPNQIKMVSCNFVLGLLQRNADESWR